MEDRKICYEVGALLYCPANNEKIAEYVTTNRFGNRYSLALCLEDTIANSAVEQAESIMLDSLKKISEAYHGINKKDNNNFYLPKIFIRVREPEQLKKIDEQVNEYKDIICGYIFPKYSVENGLIYNDIIKKINKRSDKMMYMMPILESSDIIDYATRKDVLLRIKTLVDSVKEYVLNVRVGGNDFCNEFAVRRHYDETIYNIKPISDILSDILTVFSRNYVVSGAVWEFFGSDNNEWKDGLVKELALDRLNGFVGKTVIHPKQIDVVNEMLKVSHKDYEDASQILDWRDDNDKLVGKSFNGERMNEVKTHVNWARKIMLLSEIYGVS